VILVERLTLAGKRIADCTISQYLSGTRSITSNAVERIETAINLKGWFSANDGDLSEDAPPRSVLEAPQWVPPAPQVQANEAKVQLVAPNPAPLIQSPVETCSAAGAIAAPMLDIPFERRLWNVADIANYLRCSPRHTADRIINLPGFPAGFALPLGESDTDGNQLWYAREVVEWALSFQRKR
jgi:hypothetical protein